MSARCAEPVDGSGCRPGHRYRSLGDASKVRSGRSALGSAGARRFRPVAPPVTAVCGADGRGLLGPTWSRQRGSGAAGRASRLQGGGSRRPARCSSRLGVIVVLHSVGDRNEGWRPALAEMLDRRPACGGELGLPKTAGAGRVMLMLARTRSTDPRACPPHFQGSLQATASAHRRRWDYREVEGDRDGQGERLNARRSRGGVPRRCSNASTLRAYQCGPCRRPPNRL